MSDSRTRPRAQSDVVRDFALEPPARASHEGDDGERASPERVRDFALPRRAATSMEPPRSSQNMRRRSNATRRTSVAQRQTVASREPTFTLAGPDDSQQLRAAHEAFVHPGYAELNPSYAQANNTKPVWSLAKPLPRIVRPGMVPTKSELMESRMNAELPAENSQNLGLEVNPNDLEQGKIQKSRNYAKISAQVQDARKQREKNFMNSLQTGGGLSARRTGSRISGATPQTRRARTSTWAPELEDIPGEESGEQGGSAPPADDQTPQRPRVSDEPKSPLPPVLERPEPASSDGKDGDADSMTTVGPEEWAYPEDLQPILDGHIEDEIHNNHTSWSVVRTHYRESLAELLAVVIQLTIGFCSDLAVTAANPSYSSTTDWAWGLATMIAIYVSGGISGAHLNPSISTMLWFFRGFPKRKLPHYYSAQFLGAFVAAFITYGVYYSTIQQTLQSQPASNIVDSFVTSQRYNYVHPVNAFFNEFVGTACLGATVLALGDDQNAPPGAGMNSLIIGLVITVLSMAFGRQTGAALNPSRDFGPRLALLALGYGGDLFTNPYWFYGPWAATLSGAFVGAGLYDFFIFTGGESPINYPWSRTKRSILKSRRKWGRRLHLTKKNDFTEAKDQI